MVEAALHHIPGGASTADRPGMVTSKLGLPTGLAGLWLAIPTHDRRRVGSMREHGSDEVGVRDWDATVSARETKRREICGRRALGFRISEWLHQSRCRIYSDWPIRVAGFGFARFCPEVLDCMFILCKSDVKCFLGLFMHVYWYVLKQGLVEQRDSTCIDADGITVLGRCSRLASITTF